MRHTVSLSIRLLLEADQENADAILQSAFKSSESRLIDLHMFPERALMLRGEEGQITGCVVAQESRIGP
jgi:hypothetical protein